MTKLPEGIKFDDEKRQWTLIPYEALEEVVKVLEQGAKKYAPFNWIKLDPIRFKNALMRHVTAYIAKEENDPETGLNHMAHAACNCLFLLWLDIHGQQDKSNEPCMFLHEGVCDKGHEIQDWACVRGEWKHGSILTCYKERIDGKTN